MIFSEFIETISKKTGDQRERLVEEYVIQQQKLIPIQFVPLLIKDSKESNMIEIMVGTDYLRIGDSLINSIRIPLMPQTAQKILDVHQCMFPTKRLVDVIYKESKVKLSPIPIAYIKGQPGRENTKTYIKHHTLIENQLTSVNQNENVLIVGHKKDIVLTNQLLNNPNKVAIYGWHQLNGVPIQPLYLGHGNFYVDYSHGIRPLHKECKVNGVKKELTSIFQDKLLGPLLTGSEPLKIVKYT